jgi:hypothetical protein
LNGKIAMVSFVIMCIVYLKTGQLIPNVWWVLENQHQFDIISNNT